MACSPRILWLRHDLVTLVWLAEPAGKGSRQASRPGPAGADPCEIAVRSHQRGLDVSEPASRTRRRGDDVDPVCPRRGGGAQPVVAAQVKDDAAPGVQEPEGVRLAGRPEVARELD